MSRNKTIMVCSIFRINVVMFLIEGGSTVECVYNKTASTFYVKFCGKREDIAKLPILPKGAGDKLLTATENVCII